MMTRISRGIQPIIWAMVLFCVAAPGASAKSFPWRVYAEKPEDWYKSGEGARIAENVLSHQSQQGDWPKNIDTSEKPYDGDRSRLVGTFDNGATVGEIRFLAKAYAVTGQTRYRDAFKKALDHVLAAQYPNGGWPQTFPPGKSYPRHITLNDNTMVNLLELVRDVARSDAFGFVDRPRRSACERAFDVGIDCIVKCQVKAGGRPAVWCAQHDEKTLEPRGARTYELPSLSGSESAGVLLLLMSLEDPTADAIRAVHAGARWFEASRLTGIRQVMVDGNKVIVQDRNAPPLWARFYEIDTNRPFFCGRDGVKKYDMAEIEAERRNGYAWYGTWGNSVAARYASWKEKWKDGANAARRTGD
jgi:PelA/Pel-15E family pectate lyase